MEHITIWSGDLIYIDIDEKYCVVTIDSEKHDLLKSIEISLSRLPRFAGHSKANWSVLDHTFAVEKLCDLAGCSRETRLYALLHDAHEILTGDIPGPVKKLLGNNIKRIENAFDVALYYKLGVGCPGKAVTEYAKLVDKEVLVVEQILRGKGMFTVKHNLSDFTIKAVQEKECAKCSSSYSERVFELIKNL